MIGNLQILRAFAATGVVILHSNATVLGVHTEFQGVALFFVLSGYLMCRIRNRPASVFLVDRFWRIVPSYWAATAVMLSTFAMWSYWPPAHVFLSFLFVPHQTPNGLHPVLGVGWTLNFEMYFYVVFAVALYASRHYAPIIAAFAIAVIYFVVPYVTHNEAIRFYYGGFAVWYFVAGMALWYADELLGRARLSWSFSWWTLPASIAVYCVLIICAAKCVSYPLNESVLWVLLPPLLFATALICARCGADLKPPFLMLLGNASYACYLLHTIFIELMRHRGITVDGSIIKTVAIVVASWTVAVVWHLTVEKTILFVRKALRERRIVKFA